MVAKNLVELGFKRNEKVKTSFAPGSKVTAEILEESGLAVLFRCIWVLMWLVLAVLLAMVAQALFTKI